MTRAANRFAWVLGILFVACGPVPPDDADTVVLVHGLGRTPASMTVLRARLEGAGFRVVNFGYPSTSEEIKSLVDSLGAAVENCCAEPASTVHFVTHSMGGVLVRSYLAGRSTQFDGRVVMLSPPNQGSEVIDAFGDSPLLRTTLGPAGARLGTDSTGIAQQLGPINFSLGIITGDRSINPIGSWLIPGPDDGKVSVARAQLDGSAGFIVVSATHTFIMNRSDVAEQIVHFLREGVFLSQSPEGGAP
ncbi:MAG: alpha/beta fold hydrolase [Gemmatimonadetes bacterium]|nr:alpha/beta fold hydrolase [Gemmatimonadota bacterium]